MFGANLTPLDLRRFHRLERDFYKKLIHQLKLGVSQDRVKWILALWLWLESIGHHDFIRHVSSFEDDVIAGFIEEGSACLDRLIGRSDPQRGDELPMTSTLVAEPMDLRYFDYHRNLAAVRVTDIYNNVACIIFDDDVMEVAARNADHPASRRLMSSGLHHFSWWRDLGEGSSRQAFPPSVQPQSLPISAALNQGTAAVKSTLNPTAEPWSPAMNQSPEDQRSMFITFSRGYPLTREEIVEFFNTRYGKCVEMVMIERAAKGSPPMYGRVVFTSASMIAVVLNGQQTAKFVIRGKHLWARIYVPRQQ